MISSKSPRGDTATTHSAPQGAATAQLRILATTDIHMQLTGFDYIADRDTARHGLAGIGTLIAQARAEAMAQNRACVLFDNGDLFQGTPMGDHLAHLPVTGTHPTTASMNHLRYTALGVGNHDLDFGLPYLQQLATQLEAPVVTSNLQGDDLAPLRHATLIDCPVPHPSGGTPTTVLRIGVLSVLPRQTEIWNHHWLQNRARVGDAVDCLQKAVPELRAQGADLIVVLAHMGITADGETPSETALDLARIAGIDAMITGHTHRRFPGRDHRHGAGVDTAQGRLFQIPTVMPGHGGSDLGILDLTLKRDTAGAWRVIGHVNKLRENTADTPPLPAILKATDQAHETLRRRLACPMGRTSKHLHNYFSLMAPTSSSAFAAYAKARLVRQSIAGTPDADLPLLSSASGHTAGGHDGPDHYVSIPKGDVLRRHLAGLNPFNNQIWAIRITGSELRHWLEHAARVFADLAEGQARAALLGPKAAAFNFDTIYGVTYTIDPTQPVGMRIGHLSHNGAPVRLDQMFLLATNQFRVGGGGGFKVLPSDRVALRLPGNTNQMYADALADPHHTLWETDTPWRFDIPTPTDVELYTSPHAEAVLDEIAHLEPRTAGLTEAGFLKLHLTL